MARPALASTAARTCAESCGPSAMEPVLTERSKPGGASASGAASAAGGAQGAGDDDPNILGDARRTAVSAPLIVPS